MKCSSVISLAALSAVLLTISVQNSCLSAQTKPGPTSTLNDQKTELTLKLPNVPPVVLDTAEVERLITTLAGRACRHEAASPGGRPCARVGRKCGYRRPLVGPTGRDRNRSGCFASRLRLGRFVHGSDRDRATEPALVSLHRSSEACTSEARIRAEMRDFDGEVLCRNLPPRCGAHLDASHAAAQPIELGQPEVQQVRDLRRLQPEAVDGLGRRGVQLPAVISTGSRSLGMGVS